MLQKKRGRQLASTGAKAKRLPAVPGWAFACSQQSMRIAVLQEEYSGLAGPIKQDSVLSSKNVTRLNAH
jgi:hypothetical protein